MAPSLPALAMPTRFSAGFSSSVRLRNVRGAVTVMSALVAMTINASAVTVPPEVTTSSRRIVLKLIIRNVTSAGPAGTSEN